MNTRVTTLFYKILISITAAMISVVSVKAQETGQQNNAKAADCFISKVREKAECYNFSVPLDYQNPDSEKISIFVTVLKPTGSIIKKDPFFIYAGGPGQAASSYGILVKMAFHKIREERAIIMMDQRGTGKSSPLSCNTEGYLPTEAATLDMIKDCRNGYDIDVRHFDSLSIVRDTDYIRKQLGYAKLNLWGGSFGTRMNAYYAMTYPDNVRSIIMDGVLPTHTSLFKSAPVSAERAMQIMLKKCESDKYCHQAFPSLRNSVDELLSKAAAGKAVYNGIDPVTGDNLELDISRDMMVEAIRSNLYMAENTQYLPLMITKAASGDLKGILTAYLNGAGVSDTMFLGSTLSILCSEEVPTVSPAEIKEAGKGSFAEDSYYRFWSTACVNWQAKAAYMPFKVPFKTNIPTLVLSGELDPVTPPTLGDELMKGLSNANHIIVSGTGHNTSHIGCMPKIMAKFVNDLQPKTLDSSCLSKYIVSTAFVNYSGATIKAGEEK